VSDVGIWTTFGTNSYTSTFGGTSAACPLAAGAVGLMLEANPELTWRDVQHVLVRTARQCDPTDPGWAVNGAGRHVNHDFGFGAVDAGAATALAAHWPLVGPALSAATDTQVVGIAIPNNDPNGVVRAVSVADDLVV